MTPSTQEFAAKKAVEDLRSLRARFPGKTRVGGGLTLKTIAREIGLESPVTLSWWLGDGKSHHLPRGTTLGNLIKFLARCNGPRGEGYLKRITKPQKKENT